MKMNYICPHCDKEVTVTVESKLYECPICLGMFHTEPLPKPTKPTKNTQNLISITILTIWGYLGNFVINHWGKICGVFFLLYCITLSSEDNRAKNNPPYILKGQVWFSKFDLERTSLGYENGHKVVYCHMWDNENKEYSHEVSKANPTPFCSNEDDAYGKIIIIEVRDSGSGTWIKYSELRNYVLGNSDEHSCNYRDFLHNYCYDPLGQVNLKNPVGKYRNDTSKKIGQIYQSIDPNPYHEKSLIKIVNIRGQWINYKGIDSAGIFVNPELPYYANSLPEKIFDKQYEPKH